MEELTVMRHLWYTGDSQTICGIKHGGVIGNLATDPSEVECQRCIDLYHGKTGE